MEITKDIFKQKLISGEISPDKVERTFDAKGPIIMLVFSRFRLRVHMHFNDSGEYENTGRAHIKTYEGEHIEFIDGREVALIRMHIEKHEKLQKIKDKIDKDFSSVGLNKIEVDNNNFSVAYLRKSRLQGSIVFLIVDNYDDNLSAKEYVQIAKKWCKEKLKAIRYLNDVWLNLIILHEGQLNKSNISGLTDKTGYHRTITRSVTIIDKITNEIHQVSFGTNVLFNASTKVANAVKRLKNLEIE